MKERQNLINSIRNDVEKALSDKFSEGQCYKQLIRKLVIQGMIKLM